LGQEAYAGGGYAVPCCVFYEVHGLVGQVEEFSFGARIAGIGGYAYAGGDMGIDAGIFQPHRFTDQLVEAASYA
jgi:hypothetical protein